jgi:hypothetical protein
VHKDDSIDRAAARTAERIAMRESKLVDTADWEDEA